MRQITDLIYFVKFSPTAFSILIVDFEVGFAGQVASFLQ